MLRVLLAALLTLASSPVLAGELDNEQAVTNDQVRLSKELPATVVVRVHKETSQVEVLHSETELPADADGQALVEKLGSQFKSMASSDRVAGELDQDSSRSSWYFYFTNYYWRYPTYYYYGYTYNYYPYYYYNYGYYSYYYYRWGW